MQFYHTYLSLDEWISAQISSRISVHEGRRKTEEKDGKQRRSEYLLSVVHGLSCKLIDWLIDWVLSNFMLTIVLIMMYMAIWMPKRIIDTYNRFHVFMAFLLCENKKFQSSERPGGNILWLEFCVHIVKALIPILALLPMLCVCENPEWWDLCKIKKRKTSNIASKHNRKETTQISSWLLFPQGSLRQLFTTFLGVLIGKYLWV